MSNAKQSWLQKFKIANSNLKKLLKKFRKRIAFDLFSRNSKPLQYHHSRFWIIFSAKNELNVFFSLHSLYYSLYYYIVKIYLTYLIYYFRFIQIIQSSEDDGKIGMFMTIDKQIQKLKKENTIQDYQNAANLRYMKSFSFV